MGTEGPFAWLALFFIGLALIIIVGVPLYGAALIIRDWFKK